MQTVLVILTVIVSILLICVVLVQKSKGGGLASNFAGNNQVMGVRRTNDFIEKTTWTLAIIILFLSIFSSIIGSNNATDTQRYNTAAPEQTEQTTFPTASETPAPVATDAAPAAAEVPAE